DKVIFVPTFIPPHKQFTNAPSAHHRFALTKAFCKENKHFIAEDCEIKRGGVSYTYDTLLYIIEKYKPTEKPVLLIGQENAFEFDKWKNASQIAELAHIVIAKRKNDLGGIDKKNAQNRSIGEYTGGFETSEINFPYEHTILENLIIPLSSTEIRQRIFDKKSFRYLVPDAVFRYIKKWHLYGYK
ncbi:MAG: nicotinate (nicotinamide) nucleotide adenylyltransferase, partial [Treponema sp.]|nr:nicotinate (nicotinamide) nucleotide adenylyltransferase [Treponema sp.]